MTSLLDVTSVSVADGQDVPVSASVAQVTVTLQDGPSQIVLQPATGPQIVEIQTPGTQGAPGLKNVYVQHNDPAYEFGWGVQETNFIWIEIN